MLSARAIAVRWASYPHHKHNDTIRRCLASSALPDVGRFVPDMVKEAVKNSVINEVTKRDIPVNGKSSRPNGNSNAAWNNVSNNNSIVNGNHSSHTAQTGPVSLQETDIDSPLSPIGEDPLIEWHLHTSPKHSLPSTIAPLNEHNDPFILSKRDTTQLSSSIRSHLITSDHPILTQAASHFFSPDSSPGKLFRPTMVFLLARALHNQSNIQPSQRRLAEIAEMIHTASLFHDDVLDESDTRRGNPAAHTVFGNKVAILAGDFLLARASRQLARLRNVMVMETMSLIIDHLIQGEVMQIKPMSSDDTHIHTTNNNTNSNTVVSETNMEYYLRKNFYKTASLMAQSCMSTAILAGCDVNTVDACYRYGKHIGLAFQLVDDVLDYEGSQDSLGKPPLSDLRAGIATAPVLYTLDDDDESVLLSERQELSKMMTRKFRNDGDVERACHIIEKGRGIQRTKDLAQIHAELAIEAVMELPLLLGQQTLSQHTHSVNGHSSSSSSSSTASQQQQQYRDALVHLANRVVNRTR